MPPVLVVRALDAVEPTPIFDGAPRGPFVSPDGQRFLIIKPGSDSDPTALPTLGVVQPFDEELKRFMPAK